MKIKFGEEKKMTFQYIEKRIECTMDQEIPSSNPILIFLPTNWLVPPVTQPFYLPGSGYEQFYCGLSIWY